MLITNDVALITFVPFAIFLLKATKQSRRIIFVVVMQTVAANLGSMLTPVGNPQNLYLYSFYHIKTADFFKITLPVTVFGLVLIAFFLLFGKKEDVEVRFNVLETVVSVRQLYFYLFLFLLSLAAVFYIIDYKVAFAAVGVGVFITNRRLFARVDYGLIATFVCFFIFVGNIGNIAAVSAALTGLIERRELASAVILSQFISNVPAAVLLSHFTGKYKELVLGTDIGGLGTLVASLASLISFKLYVTTEGARPLKYLGIFTVVNVLMLFLLLTFSLIFLF
jgi:di/tricarboxylate transporter